MQYVYGRIMYSILSSFTMLMTEMRLQSLKNIINYTYRYQCIVFFRTSDESIKQVHYVFTRKIESFYKIKLKYVFA